MPQSNPTSTTPNLSPWRLILSVFLSLILILAIVFGIVKTIQNRSYLSAENVTSVPISTQSNSTKLQYYGFLNISKQKFQKIPYKRIKSFLDWTRQTKDYQYVLIMFEDGTALQCQKDKVVYGNLDTQASQVSPIRGSIRDSGKYWYVRTQSGRNKIGDENQKGINGLD